MRPLGLGQCVAQLAAADEAADMDMFEKAMDVARARVRGRKAIWYRIADEAAPSLNVVIQSKK